MAWLRWLAPVALALVVAWLVAGGGACGREAGPQLVQVLDVAPREVEVGERLDIVGQGFPPGKPARVTFRGTLRRPGERPERGAEIVVSAAVTGPEEAHLAFTEAEQALFCGAGDAAVHTTFEGDVEVAFAAAAPGAPPVAGVLRHVTLDVRPAASAANADNEREGARVLASLGLKAAPGPAGLAVEAVAHGSRAEAAGLVPGDVVVAWGGLRVATAGDVLSPPGAREVSVGVRRSGASGETTRTIDVEGLRQSPPAELLAPALLVLAALAAVLLFAAPSRPALASQLQAAVSRLRARVPAAARGGRQARTLAGTLADAARDVLPPAGPAASVDALVCALLAAMPFGQYLVAAQLDVGLLFVAAATGLAVAAGVSAGSPLRGLRASLQIAWQHVPAAVAVASVVLGTGSLRLREIARVQGGWPWEWLAFRSPVALVALGLLLAAARIEPDSTAPRGPWLQAAWRAHRLIVAGLASALFLGGWTLPGLPPAAQDARAALELLGAAFLLGKTWALAALLAWSRQAMPSGRLAERSRRTALLLVPASLLVLGGTAAWARWGPAGATRLLVSGALLVAVALGVGALAQRVRHGLLSSGGEGRLSPFL